MCVSVFLYPYEFYIITIYSATLNTYTFHRTTNNHTIFVVFYVCVYRNHNMINSNCNTNLEPSTLSNSIIWCMMWRWRCQRSYSLQSICCIFHILAFTSNMHASILKQTNQNGDEDVDDGIWHPNQSFKLCCIILCPLYQYECVSVLGPIATLRQTQVKTQN